MWRHGWSRPGTWSCPSTIGGGGESEGIPNRLIPLEQVEDARSALTFLQLQPDVDPRRIGLYGLSFGGGIVTYAAAMDSRVACTVAVSGPASGRRWMEALRTTWQMQAFEERLRQEAEQRGRTGEFTYVDPLEFMDCDPDFKTAWRGFQEGDPRMARRITFDSAQAMMDFRPELVAHLISPRPIMWIHGAREKLIPVDEAIANYRQAGEPKKLVIFPDYDHLDLDVEPGLFQQMDLAIDWFDRELKASSLT
ncbi:MAG: alpha/beta fold hydrolase [Sphaerobacter sp.]|nr:alpha/beta fold hydrolase [Sphaerobacter sp.]